MNHPPLIGGINAIVSPFFRFITSPDGKYSSFNASVNESSSKTMFARFGYFSAIIFLNKDVLAESSIVIETSDTFPAASLADANKRTLIEIVIVQSNEI